MRRAALALMAASLIALVLTGAALLDGNLIAAGACAAIALLIAAAGRIAAEIC